MQIYLFLIISSMCIYLLNKYMKNETIEKTLTFILFFILFIISAIRKHVGTDYGTYQYVYTSIKDREYDKEGMEIGYFYLNKLVYNLFGGEYAIFIITSLIIIVLTYITIKKFSVDPIFSGILFMCLLYITGFNIIRQHIAVAIIFYSLRYCETKIKWIIPIIIASLFHITSLFVIPFYFIAKLNLNRKYYIIISAIGGGLYLGYGRTVIYLTNFIEGFQQYRGTNFITEGANPMRTFINIFILIFCLVSYEEIMRYKKIKFSFNMMIFGVICSLFMIKGKIFARIVDYFTIYVIILIPYVVVNMKKYNLKKYTIIIITFIMLASYGYFYYSVKTGQSGVVPYKTYIYDRNLKEKVKSLFYKVE